MDTNDETKPQPITDSALPPAPSPAQAAAPPAAWNTKKSWASTAAATTTPTPPVTAAPVVHNQNKTRGTTTTTTTSSPTALIPDFQAGVTACLRSWSALATAVQGGWGGVESHAKADFLRQTIIDYFVPASPNTTSPTDNPKKRLHDESQYPVLSSAHELEDVLAIYLEEEFSVQLEDDSERQVAQTIWHLYETCLVQGDATAAHALMRQQQTQASVHVVSQASQFVDTNDDDDDHYHESMKLVAQSSPGTAPMDQEPTTTTKDAATLLSSADYASHSLFGPPTKPTKTTTTVPIRQLGQSVSEPHAAATAAPMLDDDGFTTIVSKKQTHRHKKQKAQQPSAPPPTTTIGTATAVHPTVSEPPSSTSEPRTVPTTTTTTTSTTGPTPSD